MVNDNKLSKMFCFWFQAVGMQRGLASLMFSKLRIQATYTE
jgi:hypothetical protein